MASMKMQGRARIERYHDPVQVSPIVSAVANPDRFVPAATVLAVIVTLVLIFLGRW
jgi:hypothetical protein